MSTVNRVLHPNPDTSLDVYVARGGMAGFKEAQQLTQQEIIDKVLASGLRGRGGAGFPTGRKWITVSGNAKATRRPASVIVNGAEGEPGTFKDRSIIRSSPFVLLEGALIAARAVGADLFVIALKDTFNTEVALVESALEKLKAAGYGNDLEWLVFRGPTNTSTAKNQRSSRRSMAAIHFRGLCRPSEAASQKTVTLACLPRARQQR